MSGQALIIGGTKGLGRHLALTARARNINVLVLGRSAIPKDDALSLAGVSNIRLDIADESTWDVALGVIAQFAKLCPDYVFWNAGIFERVRLADQSEESIDRMINTHLRGPVKFLGQLHRLMLLSRPLAENPGSPYHLITIASTSSYRMRVNETVYCALKAAKAAWTRNFSRELARDLPGSKTTLVNPAGMKTDLFAGSGQDTSRYMEPSAVAKIIWDEVLNQTEPFGEINILRDDNGTPRVVRGPQTPEQPF